MKGRWTTDAAGEEQLSLLHGPLRIASPPRLAKENLRDYVNAFRLAAKFRFVPFRGYYRIRAYKYMFYRDIELKLLRFLVKPGSCSLDVGANFGIVTFFLSRYCTHVYAFEPNPIPYSVLNRIKDRNVTLYPVALTDRCGEIDFIVPKRRKGWTTNGAGVDRVWQDGYAILRIPACRIDDLALRDLGFIKIDVEGHENKVLAGALETLRRCRPNLFIENEFSHAGSAAAEVFAMLRDLDYDGYFLADGVLTNIGSFSFEEYQVRPRAEGTGQYVKNFIFLPR
jgi:FkbM family methyltransferase